jgi:catechol O-methyltransferase
MNIGPIKGSIITNIIQATKPKILLELGGYIGYSTILFASNLPEGGRHICVEHNPTFAAIIMALVDLAGLKDIVQVIIGASSEVIPQLAGGKHLGGKCPGGGEKGQMDQIGLLFLDHLKPLYTTDLKLCEELRLVRKGTVVVADNMVKPGNPEFHRYVNLSMEEKAREMEGMPGGMPGAVSVGVTGGGRKEVVYETEWIESWEPQGVRDAVEVCRCASA